MAKSKFNNSKRIRSSWKFFVLSTQYNLIVVTTKRISGTHNTPTSNGSRGNMILVPSVGLSRDTTKSLLGNSKTVTELNDVNGFVIDFINKKSINK